MEKVIPISLKLNFTPNTLGCYGLNSFSGFYVRCGEVSNIITKIVWAGYIVSPFIVSPITLCPRSLCPP